MRLTKEEKECLKRILEEKSKKSISEDITIVNISHALLLSLEKRKLWEIKDFSKKMKYTEKEVKKVFVKERRITKGILNKLKSSQNHSKTANTGETTGTD